MMVTTEAAVGVKDVQGVVVVVVVVVKASHDDEQRQPSAAQVESGCPSGWVWMGARVA